MVILIVGESETGKKLLEKFEKAGHRVLQTADAGKTEEILSKEEQIDMFVAAPSLFAGEGDKRQEPEAETDFGNKSALHIGDGIASGPDWGRAEELYASCVTDTLSALQKAISRMEGGLKRICYLNPACGSINGCLDKTDYGLHLCAAALNMQINILYNRLRPLGYTFRLFGTGAGDLPEKEAAAAYWYFCTDRSTDPESAKHEDENRLVMRDREGREIPF